MTDRDDSNRPDNERAPSTTENLRIIGAEEAGSLVARLPGGETDAVGSDDDRWEPAAESPRSLGRRPVFESIPDAAPGFDDEWEPAVLSPLRRPEPLELSDLSVPTDSDDITVLGPAPATGEQPQARERQAPVTVADDPSLELPHWTAPPTGQVPRALIDESRRGDDSWSTFTSSPRWRDSSSDWEADDYSDVAELGDDLPRFGALDDRERPAIDQFFAFDELDDPGPEPDRPRQSRRVSIDRLGTAEQRGPAPEPAVMGGHGGRPQRSGGRNVPVATALGVGMAAVAVALFRIGPGATMVLIVGLLALGAAEFFDTARKGGYHPATLLGLAAAASLPAAAYWRGLDAYPLIFGLTVVFGLLWYLFGAEDNVTANLGVTVLGVAYVGGLGGFAALILRTPGADTTALLMCGVIPTIAHDVMAYVVGRNAGRSLLSPTVSPNKTVEGLLGGCIGAITASVVFNDLIFRSPFDGLTNSLLLGVVVAVLAPLGDLVESLIKRDLGVKDMGTALPGHGGVLDRFDTMLFVLPGLYYLALLRDLLPH